MSTRALFNSLITRVAFYFDVVKNLLVADDLYNLQPASVLLVCHDADRGFILEGKKYAQLLDSINDRLSSVGIAALTISLPFSIESTVAYGRVFNVNNLLARALLVDKVCRLIGKKGLSRDNRRVRAWSLVLDRVMPTVIIGIQPPIELCMAAKSNGILVADLQHGIISNEGYYGLAYRASYGQEGWPSCVLCWNRTSATLIESEVGRLTTARVIGNPWFLRFINTSKADRLVSQWQEKMTSVGHNNRKIILITLQWGFDHFHSNHKIGIPIGLLSFIKGHGLAFDWWIRVHPVMLQGSLRAETFLKLKNEFVFHKNVYWEHCTDFPLPVVLANTDLHITLSSATTIEAGWFGIKTALLSSDYEALNKWFSDEITNGIAEIVPAESECISRWIDRESSLSRVHRGACMDSQPLNSFIKDIETVCLVRGDTTETANNSLREELCD